MTVCEAWGASLPVESQAAIGDANQAFPVISRGNWIWKCGFFDKLCGHSRMSGFVADRMCEI